MSFFRIPHKITNKYALPLLVVLTVAAVLFFGLRPKEWTRSNNIHWLSEQKALEFTSPSIAYVADLHFLDDRKSPDEFTIQMPVVPANQGKLGFRPILMINDGLDRSQLIIWQWGASVVVMNGNDYDYSRAATRLSGRDALIAREESLITVTTGSFGTRLFINGALVAEQQNVLLTLPNSHTTRLILGNSVYGKHPWEGKIYGLALNGTALSPEGVTKYYKKWVTQRDLVFDSIDEPLLLYRFNEYKDGIISDETGHNQPLLLPPRLVVLKKTFLSPPWHKRKLSILFLVDVVLNIIGFIPVGAILYYWLLKSEPLPKRYNILIVVGCCFLLSLSIETIQVWLPHRHSSLLDLILNTSGGWLGVIVVGKIQKQQITKSIASIYWTVLTPPR